MSTTGVTKDTLEMSYGYSGMSAQATNSGVPHAEWFVRDPDGKLIAQVDRNTTEPDRFYLTDAQQSVVATIDTTGTVRRYVYEPYGQQIRTWIDPNPTNNTTNGATPPDGSHNTPTPADNATDTNPWRYASGYHDTETGHLKYGTRYYNPTLARWTQTDPKAGTPCQPPSLNPYLYTSCNPTNRTDPTGRYWTEELVEDTWNTITDWDGWDEVGELIFGYGSACFGGAKLAWEIGPLVPPVAIHPGARALSLSAGCVGGIMLLGISGVSIRTMGR
jgi:RHS repeat-associated protein